MASAAVPFSHKLHHAIGLECGKCHSGVTASAKAADNNMPPQTVCTECHQAPNEKMVKALPRAAGVGLFNHALHLKLGRVAPVINAAIVSKSYHTSSPHSFPSDRIRAYLANAGTNACIACHRGVEDNEATDQTMFPQIADCLVCHSKSDVPFSCEKCHLPTQPLKPVSHNASYVDFHSSGRGNLEKPCCVICHGRKFQCLGCHEAASSAPRHLSAISLKPENREARQTAQEG